LAALTDFTILSFELVVKGYNFIALTQPFPAEGKVYSSFMMFCFISLTNTSAQKLIIKHGLKYCVQHTIYLPVIVKLKGLVSL
jgi:hypothetical protein